ncbi:MAG: hypothetical protein HYT08_02045 [Candidatus Levybacteria bacterium]|nr:hypothetical protein [Candidatus Levybacteria bacterium]
MIDSSSLRVKENYSATKSVILISTLLLANLITIGLFIQNQGSIMQVLWTYWLQSVIIGAVNVIRILNSPLDKFIEDVQVGAQAAYPLSSVHRLFMALFFIIHYGGFHFIYMFFLFAFSLSSVPITINGDYVGTITLGGNISSLSILISGFFFAIHHGLSYLSEKNQLKREPAVIKLSLIMGRPYARIIPMQIIIIFAPIIALYYGSNLIFVVFMVLKTFIDIIAYQKGLSHPKVPNNDISQTNQVRQALNSP